MSNFEDSEIVVYKYLAEDVIKKLTPICEKLRAKVKKGISCYDAVNAHFLECDNIDNLEFYSSKMREWQNAVNKTLAVLDRLEIIIRRNKERVEFLKERCDELGIYNDKVEPKVLQEKINSEIKNISEENLNLNQSARSAVVARYIDGNVFMFKNNRINFDIEENKIALSLLSKEEMAKVIERFPYIIGAIPDDMYILSDVKNIILKETVVYVANHLKDRSIKESNQILGAPLSNAGNINSIEQFAEELKNLFNVSAKNVLKENFPESASDIDDKLSCNEQSEFLPRSKVRAALANGVMGKTEEVSEEQSSEEERKEKEKETRLMLELDELLDGLLAETQEEKAEEERQEQVEEQVEIDRQGYENSELNIEAELEKELEKLLRKDGINEQ